MASRPSRAKRAVEARAFAGFGESKIHAAPEGAFEDDKRLDWSTLTFKGEPIPAHFRSLFTYAMTDQGMAETEAAIEARGGRAVTEFARDMQDKLVDKFSDDLADSAKLIHSNDPLGVVMKRHLPEGMRGRWLSPRKMNEAGMLRGVLEYAPVLIDNPENPGTKIPCKLGGMMLAAVPEQLAVEAEKHYHALGEEIRASANDKVREHNERNVGDALERAATRRGKLDDLVGEIDDSERAQLAETVD